jgi:hypothetical protein
MALYTIFPHRASSDAATSGQIYLLTVVMVIQILLMVASWTGLPVAASLPFCLNLRCDAHVPEAIHALIYKGRPQV